MKQDKKLDYIIGVLQYEMHRIVDAHDYEKVGYCTADDINKLEAKKVEEIS